MYEELIKTAKICCGDISTEDCVAVCTNPHDKRGEDVRFCRQWLIKDLYTALAALLSENAEKDREIKRLRKELTKANTMDTLTDYNQDFLRAEIKRVEAERDAAMERQKELDDALRDMVCQYCSHDGRLDHEFMSAGEHAFDVLDLDYGAPVDMLWRGAQGEG